MKKVATILVVLLFLAVSISANDTSQPMEGGSPSLTIWVEKYPPYGYMEDDEMKGNYPYNLNKKLVYLALYYQYNLKYLNIKIVEIHIFS
ncbi:MAG: hypothetical protein HQK76_19340 [Desulfobacterales bacterium]|nr:hypothetical protein [Desulfobacterales bacterium]